MSKEKTGKKEDNDQLRAKNKIGSYFIGDKRKRITFILILIVIMALAGGWFWFVFLYRYISVDDAYIYRDRATISSKTLARVAGILVNEGDVVRKGEILIQLDNVELLAQKNQAEASLEYVKKSADLAKINMEKAEDDYRRIIPVYKSNNISYENYIHAKKAYESAVESYGMALKQIDISSAQLDLVKINLQNTIITSVFNGIVSKKWVVDGDVVQPGQPMLSVNNTETLWVIANIEETKMPYVHINSDVKISVDAYRGVKFKGRVFQIGADTASQFSLIPPNNASGNFTKITQRIPVKVSIQSISGTDLAKYALIPGMSVVIKIKK